MQTTEERGMFDDAVKFILCAFFVTAFPAKLKGDHSFVGPAAILRAQRYIFDSLMANTDERMRILEKPHVSGGAKVITNAHTCVLRELRLRKLY